MSEREGRIRSAGRVSPRIAGDAPHRIGRARQLPVAVGALRRDLPVVPPLDRHRRLVAQCVIAVQRRDSIPDGVAYTLEVIVGVGRHH